MSIPSTEHLETAPIAVTPCLLSYLPILYVAWSDDLLTPTEIQVIRQSLEECDCWLSDAEKQQLNRWLDPTWHPSPQTLRRWLNTIRINTLHVPNGETASLAELGIQMALAKLPLHSSAQHSSDEARQALLKVEKELGLSGEASSRSLLDQRPEPVPEQPTQASFNVSAMTQLLDGKQAVLKQQVRTLLSDPVFAYVDTSDKMAYRAQVLQWCQWLADQGFGAVLYPKHCGGADDMSKYIAIFETLGCHDLSLTIKYGVQFGLFGGSILALGTDFHHRKYLRDVGTLDLPGCFAMTESGHGSNVRDIETVATYMPDTKDFIIHTPNESARKEYIGNAAMHGQLATVFAQLYTQGECYGVHAIMVPIRDEDGNALPNVRIEDNGEKLGLNGVDNGRIWFNGVRVPRENLLNRFANVEEDGTYKSSISSDSKRFFTMLGTLVGGRICVPMAGLSAAKSGLAIAIKYAARRRQFGPTDQPETIILDYPTHQRRLLPLLANAYALDFAHKYLAKRFLKRTEADSRAIEGLAAGLKAVSTWNTTQTLQECREACGGNGYLAVNRFAALKADTEIFTTFEGDNTVLMQLVAKGRLGQFSREFRNMNLFGWIKYFSHQLETAVTELNPITIRNTDAEHLLDSDFHLDIFQYREEYLVTSVAKRLKKRIDKGMDSYDAFLQCQTHLVNMAHAYIERVILEQFILGIKNCADASLKPILKKLCDLYALSTIEKNKGWYLEHDYLEGRKTKAIRKMVDQLCRELRPDALALVEAFAIPDACLAAPIAVEGVG